MSKDQAGSGGKWGMLLFTAVFLPLLVGLGFWQLQRAEEKQQHIERWQGAPEQTFLPIGGFSEGLKLRLWGQFDLQRFFLIDNRTRSGRAGYEVVGLFFPEGDLRVLLVNLGWTPAGPDRDVLPQPLMPMTRIELSGRLVQPAAALLLEEDHWQAGWPKRIQQVDLARIEGYQAPLFAGELRVSRPVLKGVIPGWPVVTMTPQKHRGYALQWFGLALVLLLGSGWYLRSLSQARSRRTE